MDEIKMDEKLRNGLESTTQKAEDWATRTPPKTKG